MPKRSATIDTELAPLYAKRGKFNSILEERLLDGDSEHHCIISTEVPATELDITGKLTTRGGETFWYEINKSLKRFDLDEIQLRPCIFNPPAGKTDLKSTVSIRSNDQVRCKLPTPPNKHRHHNTRSRSLSRSKQHKKRKRNHSHSHARHKLNYSEDEHREPYHFHHKRRNSRSCSRSRSIIHAKCDKRRHNDYHLFSISHNFQLNYQCLI